MKKLFVSLAIVFSSVTVFAQSSKEEAVWSSVEKLTEAIFGKRDSALLVKLVDDKVTYAHSNGNVENKAVMIRNAMANTGSYRNIQIERGTINIDGKTAVLRHNLRGISIDAKGTESPLDLGILQVWKKKHGKWKILGRQAVRIPAKS
jgi:hypothetical protein